MGIRIGRAPFGGERAVGAATWHDDLRVEPTSRSSGAQVPTFARVQRDAGGTSIGVYAYIFDNAALSSEKELYFSAQMPHGKLLGSPIAMHIHWVPTTAGTAGHKIRWGLEYTWANLGSAFPATTTIYATTPLLGAIDVALTHCLTPFGDVAPPADEALSSILLCRLFRNSSDAEDTATVSAGLLFVDAHIEMTQLGSRDEFTQ